MMAGQGILLSSFQEGEYRLGITVTDLLSRKRRAAGRHVHGGRLVAERRRPWDAELACSRRRLRGALRIAGGTLGPRSRSSPVASHGLRRARPSLRRDARRRGGGISGIVSRRARAVRSPGAMVSVLGADHGDDGHRRERPLFARRRSRRANTRCARTWPGSRASRAREHPRRRRRPATFRLQLRRLEAPVATTGAPSRSRPGRSSPPASACPPVGVRRQNRSRATTITRTPIPRGGCATSRAAS